MIRNIFPIILFFIFTIELSFPQDTVEILLKKMTLEEKIGQMLCVDSELLATNKIDIINYKLGALYSKPSYFPVPNTPNSWAKMIKIYQNYAKRTRLKIPLLFGAKIFHGNNITKGTVIFPHNIGLGATYDTNLIMQIGRLTAKETLPTGVNWAFLPTLSVPKDERWGHFYECYSEDPRFVSSAIRAFLSGLQGERLSQRLSILACVRGYPGEGGIKDGINNGNIFLSEEEMEKIHLLPFKEAIDAGAKSIMVSRASYRGENFHHSYYWITEVLKKRLGFSGFVASEENGFNISSESYEKQIEKAINAGIDMLLVSRDYRRVFLIIRNLVKERKITLERIDDAVRRILSVKLEMKLTEKVNSNYEKELKEIGSKKHRELARRAVRKSIVLLKNNGILPISGSIKKILVAGKNGKDVGNQCGGVTIYYYGSWQRWLHQTNGLITEGSTIYGALKEYFGEKVEIQYIREPRNLKEKEYDLAIAVIGERPYAGEIGYRKYLTLDYEDYLNPDLFVLEYRDTHVIRNISRAKIPLITILITGRPILIKDIMKKSDALLVVWFPGTEVEGVVDVLTGKYPPQGKLPCSWPKNMWQVPRGYTDKNYKPLFPIGYGLR